ncbi:DgyrCDS2132 [Dimorphilus gyrociliatus]|uniref:DgyrCDS2132 n=1 Tax=Dimorphilus gyrociliatus TaxID=2664684 RepID=A0A7I8VB58_9ANNE|nr:DgyrCDS2132 [Dimorphilus gyrociliatus]
MISVLKKYLQSARNSIVAQRSVIENYKGCILGLADNIQDLSTSCSWAQNHGMILIVFPSFFYAQKFVQATPDIMQYDWQHGVDISTLSIQRLPASFKNIIFEMTVIDSVKIDQFKDVFLPKLSIGLPDSQKIICLSQTDDIKPLRGGWTANFIIVNQWDSTDLFLEWFNSKEQKEARSEAGANNFISTILLELKNIISC